MRAMPIADHAVAFAMPKLGAKALATHPESIKNDFIPHPEQFPLRFRRHGVLPWAPRSTEPPAGDVGLSFHSAKYIPAGTRLDLEIPLRGQVQRFTATVVLVRERPQGFEIGLWFNSSSDAERARLVEKICHTECSLMVRPKASP